MVSKIVHSWKDELDAAVDARAERLVRLRRQLHMYPELSGEEFETSLSLYQLLDQEGYDVRMGPDGRGVMADMSCEADVDRIALRADIDALAIQDQKQVDYRSCRDGVMHACGHDVHSATVFGALSSLKDLSVGGKLPWPINVRGIFQPSEETATGAAQMVSAGAIEDVEAILALHVDPSRGVGSIGIRTGLLTAHSDGMRVSISGRGGHAARPHEAIDPIAAAAQLINTIYLMIPRVTDSRDSVVVTIGQVEGGANPNVIPEKVELRGTVRTLDFDVRERTVSNIKQVCRGVAESSGSEIDVQFTAGIPSVRNDHQMVTLVRQIGVQLLGSDCVDKINRASMGSEDFAVYLDRVPGAMFRLGCVRTGAPAYALHTPIFDVDESAILIGAKMLARSVVEWSSPDYERLPVRK